MISIPIARHIKLLLPWFGRALVLLGIIFISLRLSEYSSELDFSFISSLSWVAIIGLSIVYGVANILLALAWWNLLKEFGSTASRYCAVKVYGISQLAKYVPGNIMHLAGRQAIGIDNGIPGWPLAKSTIWELALMTVAGTFFSILILPRYFSVVSPLIANIAFLFVLVTVILALNRYVYSAAARALGYYVVFLTISSIVFVGLLLLVGDESSLGLMELPLLCGSFVVAWLVGLVTPGAPAGVGVRELVLMILLEEIVPEADLLMAVLLSRIVTVSGDVLFFLIALVLSGKKSDL
jgi:uncharacterized membrane protein YbhN (UPF0104 family)